MSRQKGSANFAGTIEVQAGGPLDARSVVGTVSDLTASATFDYTYEGMQVYCKEDKKTYKLIGNDPTVSANWTEVGGGGGDTSKCYSTDDTAFTEIVDGDYVPIYDTSESKPKKSLWSNIKSVLKTYFDDLYSTVKESLSPSSGGTTLSLTTTGEKYNYQTNTPWYATSSTGASTTAKAASLSRGSFTLVAGAKVSVKFTYANTASAPTLNVGSTGAKNIKVIDADGNVSTPAVWWNAGDVVDFIYDGTQFIMLPTYSMTLPRTSTKIERANVYSTSEKLIGQWTDGRPLYQKTISVGSGPNNTTKTVAHGISNLRHVVDIKTIIYSGSNSSLIAATSNASFYDGSQQVHVLICDNALTIKNNYDLSSFTIYVTLQYTKTTDSAISVKFADANDYSTTEQIVGTWIDGKKLYQKTIPGQKFASNITDGTSTDATYNLSTFGITNVSKIVNMKTRIGANSTVGIAWPTASPIYVYYARVQCNTTQLILQTNRSTYAGVSTDEITIQYTKTTG